MYVKFCTCEKLVVEYLELGKYASASLTMEFDSIVSACGSDLCYWSLNLCCRPLEMINITKAYAVSCGQYGTLRLTGAVAVVSVNELLNDMHAMDITSCSC